MFDLNACYVTRNEQQDYVVHWHSLHPGQQVSVYVSDDPDYFYQSRDFAEPTAVTREEQVVVRNDDPSRRHYFYLQSEYGEGAIIAERALNLEGAHNFRDLGGYETTCGRRLKWGKLYRSGKLSRLTGEDQAKVQGLGLTLVCDFRQVVEQALEPTFLGQDSDHSVASLPVTPGSNTNFIENLHQGIIVVEDASEFMQDMNRDMVASQLPQYAEMFRLILSENNPTLIHCAAGKDRTGFGSALILDVLGVDESVIVDDYLLTNRHLPIDEEIARMSGEFTDHAGAAVSDEVLRPMMEVRPEYILACFEEIRKRYRSKEHFYETALDLDKSKMELLKQRYLHD